MFTEEIELLRREVAELRARNCHLEKSLRESEDRFYKIFHGSSHPMAITTVRDKRIVDINQANAELGGFKRKELIGRSVEELRLVGDPIKSDLIRKIILQEGQVNDLEMEIRTKSGGTKTVLFSAAPIIVDDEECILGCAVDMTERLKAEKVLKESEARYRMLMEHSLQGLAIVADFRIVYCNSRFAEIVGYTVDELLSLTSDQIKVMIHPEDRAMMERFFWDRVAGKQVPAHYEFRALRKDGSEAWLEIFANLVEYQGKPAVQAAFIDITEHKKVEEALRTAQEYLKHVINCLGDPIFVKDEELRHVLVNDAMCAWTGKRHEEFIGKTALEIFPEQDMETLQRQERLVLETGRENVTEDEIRDRQGRKRTLLTRKTLLVDKEGNKQIVGIVRDITDIRRLEAQLLQAQKMEAVGILAGGIAHDFNNLLTVILGVGQMILSRFSHDSLLRQEVEEILKAGKAAASLTSQLLAFSRKQIISPKILNLNQLIEDMGNMLRRIIGEDIELVVRPHPGLGLVKADPSQLQQVIMNLAANSRDAMPQGGKLTIETANIYLDEEYVREHVGARAGHYVMLAISDNGVGMDKKIQARIFEPFFTTKKAGKGTGLGLSTVYGIVKQNDGYISVYSEPGKGATFKVYFPVAQGEISDLPAGGAPKSKLKGCETILVAEDEELVRGLICRILRGMGCRVLEASGGPEALHIARTHDGEINLLITDIVMPGMSGKELVSQLESIRPGIKVLYISGYTDNAIVHHGLLDSNCVFLQKPFTVESLTNKVIDLISG